MGHGRDHDGILAGLNTQLAAAAYVTADPGVFLALADAAEPSEVVAVVALPDGTREVYLKNGRVVTRRYVYNGVDENGTAVMLVMQDDEAPVAGTRAALAREG